MKTSGKCPGCGRYGMRWHFMPCSWVEAQEAKRKKR